MIRYVNVSNHLGDDGYSFAFWDTIVSEFMVFGDSQAWESWEEFTKSFWEEMPKVNESYRLYERIKGLWEAGA